MNRTYSVGETVKVKDASAMKRDTVTVTFTSSMENGLPSERLVRIVTVLSEGRYKVSSIWWGKELSSYTFAPYMFDPTYFDSLDRITLDMKIGLAREEDTKIYSEGGVLVDIEFVGELPYHVIDHPVTKKKIDTKRVVLPADMSITKLISQEELKNWTSIVESGIFCDQTTRVGIRAIGLLHNLIQSKGSVVVGGSHETHFTIEELPEYVFPSWLVVLPEKEEVVEKINDISEELGKLEKRFEANKKLLSYVE